LSDVSLTVTVQGGLKTQLIAGALTLTTLKGAAATTMGAKQSISANRRFFIALPPGLSLVRDSVFGSEIAHGSSIR
jgi:hypothetical protein